MTIDEELNVLEEQLRKLSVEYSAFFGGGLKKPPVDTEWRVKSMLAKHSDARISFTQRYRYKSLAQRYAIFADLWRKKMKVREEGYRRPQDALLCIQGLRTEEEHAAAEALRESNAVPAFTMECHNPRAQMHELRLLYKELLWARKHNNEGLPAGGFESFHSFVERKTSELQSKAGCRAVAFSVAVEDGRVRLKVKAV